MKVTFAIFFIYTNICKYLGSWFNIAIKIKKRYQGRQRQKYNDIINEAIRFPELLVITDKGEKLGIMSREKALKEAEKRNLDLVLISKSGIKPVAKIIDYGKFSYERKRKQEEIKKNTKIIEQKEIRLTANIAENDLNIKINRARNFISKGNRVKVSLMFKGREMGNKQKGYETMQKFIDKMEDIAKIEKSPKLMGRFYNVFLIPKK